MNNFSIPSNQLNQQHKLPEKARITDKLNTFRNQKTQHIQEKDQQYVPIEQIILKKNNPELFDRQGSRRDYYSPQGLIYTVKAKRHIKERHLNETRYQMKSKFNPSVNIVQLADDIFVKSLELDIDEKCAYAVRTFDVKKRKFRKIIKIACDCKEQKISMERDADENEGNYALLVINPVDNNVCTIHPCSKYQFEKIKSQWENSYIDQEGTAIYTGTDIRFDEIKFGY